MCFEGYRDRAAVAAAVIGLGSLSIEGRLRSFVLGGIVRLTQITPREPNRGNLPDIQILDAPSL